ncbi:MAG: STT3 domain-containing protein [Nitrososphaerales archaeon]
MAGIISIAIALRWISADFVVLFDADPWWHYRHAQEIYNNSFQPPEWDLLSHYPAGRPVVYPLGWSYTLAIFYGITHPFVEGLTLMKFSGLFVPFFASLSAIPAYFVGTMITNRWGGLITALFAVTSPIFIQVSLAGYPDHDSVVIFYTFLAVLTTLYAIKKAEKLKLENFRSSYNELIRYLPYILPALLAYSLFALSWTRSFYIYFIFLLFIPLFILFRFAEAKLVYRQQGYASLLYQKVRENRNMIIPIVLIGSFGQLISSFTNTWPYNSTPLHIQLLDGLAFLGDTSATFSILIAILVSVGAILGASFGRLKGLLVGVAASSIVTIILFSSRTPVKPSIIQYSVAELQPINLFSLDGFMQILTGVGSAPVLLGLIGIIAIIIFNLSKKREIRTAEYFVLIWIIISLSLTSSGERFLLLFAVASATAAGFVLGNLIESIKGRDRIILYAFIIIAMVLQTNYALESSGIGVELLEISTNVLNALTWLKENSEKDALIVASWDSGHLIAGYTGLRVHSDGAFCNTDKGCIHYNANVRVVDMGRIFSTDDESEAVTLLTKYISLSPDQCQELINRFGSRVPIDACGEASEIYVIASRDLLPKYYWISYFGSYDFEAGTGEGQEYLVLQRSGSDSKGNVVYGHGEVTIKKEDERSTPIIDLPHKGIKNRIISEMVSYDEQGNEIWEVFAAPGENIVDDLLWVSPGEGEVVYMSPQVKSNILTKLFFFDGKGLQQFELVFENPDIKIYKVNLR